MTAKKVTSKKREKVSKLTAPLYSAKGESVGEVDLNPEIFGKKLNKPLLTQAIRVYLTNKRAGTASTKTRSEISGGGAKPWRQKGLGRARAGSTRAPHWRGGGVVHGPKQKVYELSLPKKMKKSALLTALSAKASEKEIVVLEDLKMKEPKTKIVSVLMSKLPVKRKSLVVIEDKDETVQKSTRNLASVDIELIKNLNAYKVLGCDSLIFTKEALSKIENLHLEKK